MTDIVIVDAESDLNVYVNSDDTSGCCGQPEDATLERNKTACCSEAQYTTSCCDISVSRENLKINSL